MNSPLITVPVERTVSKGAPVNIGLELLATSLDSILKFLVLEMP